MTVCEEAVVHSSIVATMYSCGHIQLCNFKGRKLKCSSILTFHFVAKLEELRSGMQSYIILASLTRHHQARVVVIQRFKSLYLLIT